MTVVSIKKLVESGVHFGHQTRRWNPKMKSYIYGTKAGIHIIDLKYTLRHLKEAYHYARTIAAEGKTFLFVGTKPQLQQIIQDQANSCGSYYINQRWLGGLLTNFQTVRNSVAKLKKCEEMAGPDGKYEGIIKKEALQIERQRQKLERSLGGVRTMNQLPSAIVIVDCKKEHIAVQEARKLNIPTISIVDTNADPSGIDYPIPANDDSTRSVSLLMEVISAGIQEGQKVYNERVRLEQEAREKAEREARARAKAEADARAKAKAEREAKAKAEREAKAKAEKAEAPKEAAVEAKAEKAEAKKEDVKAEAKVKKAEAKKEEAPAEKKAEAKTKKVEAKKEEAKAEAPAEEKAEVKAEAAEEAPAAEATEAPAESSDSEAEAAKG